MTEAANNNEPLAAKLDLAAVTDEAFDGFYRAYIEAALRANEGARRAGAWTYRLRFYPAFVVSILLVALPWYLAGEPDGFANFLAIAAPIVAYYWAIGPLTSLEATIKAPMLKIVAAQIGCRYFAGGPSNPETKRFQTLNLLPTFSRAAYQDLFQGERHGCAFDLYEAHLEQQVPSRNGSRYITVFQGPMIRIAFPKAFAGVTVVGRDAGMFNVFGAWGNKLQRVGLVDSKFEKAFEVYSSDQVEARYLLHPVFMERLLALEASYKGNHLRCAFERGDLLIAVETANKFEMGSMFKPLADPKRVRQVVDDVAEIVLLVDAILTAEKAPLVALAAERERGAK